MSGNSGVCADPRIDFLSYVAGELTKQFRSYIQTRQKPSALALAPPPTIMEKAVEAGMAQPQPLAMSTATVVVTSKEKIPKSTDAMDLLLAPPSLKQNDNKKNNKEQLSPKDTSQNVVAPVTMVPALDGELNNAQPVSATAGIYWLRNQARGHDPDLLTGDKIKDTQDFINRIGESDEALKEEAPKLANYSVKNSKS